MNNKRLGMAFEKEVCEILQKGGYWVHFIAPDASGAQPFDIIAVKDGLAVAIDCKTVAEPVLSFSRLEYNQVFAFERWIECGNLMPLIYAKYNEHVYVIAYDKLKEYGKVDLNEI